jgi:threonine dehydrogenase-like Zn-dependent dehydrogenase
MAAGRIDVKPLISHRTGPDGLLEHMAMMRDRKGFFNKVMMVNG